MSDQNQNPDVPEVEEELLTDAPSAEGEQVAAEGAAETLEGAEADGSEVNDPEVGAAGDLQAQLDERTEDLQRITAEYANYRRRTERERQATVELAKAQVITTLLPLLDDLELAEKHGDLAEGPLKVFRDKLVGVLDGHKVEAFAEEGNPFDAERHEAVQDLSTGDEKVIGTVLRRGYQAGDRLLRTAMVIIADPAEPQEVVQPQEAPAE